MRICFAWRGRKGAGEKAGEGSGKWEKAEKSRAVGVGRKQESKAVGGGEGREGGQWEVGRKQERSAVGSGKGEWAGHGEYSRLLIHALCPLCSQFKA